VCSVCCKEITYISGPLWSVTKYILKVDYPTSGSTFSPVELDAVCSNSGSETYLSDLKQKYCCGASEVNFIWKYFICYIYIVYSYVHPIATSHINLNDFAYEIFVLI